MFRQDLRFVLRSMVRSPGFSVVAILTLALAIGANTAIFSIVDAILFRPYPYQNPNDLVVLRSFNPKIDVDNTSLSYVDFVDFRKQNRVFKDMAAIETGRYNLTGGDEPVRVKGAAVTPSLFPMIGGKPLLGRTFTPSELGPGSERVVVLSEKLWTRRFDADPSIVGKPVKLDGQLYSVVGIVPATAQFPDTDAAELFVPIDLDPSAELRHSRRHLVIARLAPGVSVDQAQSEMSGLAARFGQQYPKEDAGWDVAVSTLREYRTHRFKALSLILFGVVGMVLLIACVNVASLLLQRSAAREREVAVRSAIGASRFRVVRQLLTESVVLALVGGAAGILLAFWALKLLVRAIPNDLPSYMNNFGIDGTVLGFAVLASLVTAVVFGLAPSLRLSRPNLTESLSDAGSRSSGGVGKQRVRNALVVVEVALSLILLIGAGLMIRSFRQLQSVDPGFDPTHTLTAQVTLPENKYVTPEQRTQFVEEFVRRLAAIPGVQAAGSSTEMLLHDGLHARFRLEGQTEEERENNPLPGFRLVSGDFFDAAGLSIVRGRAFTPQDRQSPPRSVIVSESFAKRFWGSDDPIGKRVRIDVTKDDPWLDVVGVANDLTSLDGRGEDVRYELFVPYPFIDQTAYTGLSFVVRTPGDPLAVAPGLREAIHGIDADLPLVKVESMEQTLAESLWLQRITSTMFGLFAAVALLLATVGMYGSMSYSFSQRTREIGIRMALGARAGDVLGMVLRQGALLVLISVVLGLGGAFGVSRLLGRMLYGVPSTDLATFAVVTLLVILVSVVAMFIPARRATRVQPVRALKYE